MMINDMEQENECKTNDVKIGLEVQEKDNDNYLLPNMLSVTDIQKHLHISKETAYKLVKMKDFPKITIGKKYVIPEDAYLEWIKNKTRRTILL